MAFNMPFTSSPFQMPGVTQKDGTYTPVGDKTVYKDTATGQAGQFGWDDPRTQGAQTRDVLRYNAGVGLNNMNTGFNGLGTQMSGGFDGLGDQISDGFGSMADTMQYGGVYGQSQNQTPNYSPQSGNWGQGFGGSNPFMIGSF